MHLSPWYYSLICPGSRSLQLAINFLRWKNKLLEFVPLLSLPVLQFLHKILYASYISISLAIHQTSANGYIYA